MLRPSQDRLDYGNLLMAPPGFRFDKAMATSYSMNLDTLISIPVALYFSQSPELKPDEGIVQLLNAIRKVSNSIRIFCQKGQISVPNANHRLYTYIEPCVVQVTPSAHFSFHPKIWVIRFKNEENKSLFRFIVLSRNLTFDLSADVAVCLDGEPVEDGKFKTKNKPLTDFLKYLSEKEKTDWMDDFISELESVEFKLNDSVFEEYCFIPMGIKDDDDKKLPIYEEHKYDRALIISPFLSEQTLKGVLKRTKRDSENKPVLISRKEELEKISPETISQFSAWHLDDDFIDGEDRSEVNLEGTEKKQNREIHAKLYSFKDGWCSHLFLGSTNFTERGFKDNVEFLLHLKGKNSKMGPEIITEELLDKKSGLFTEFIADEKVDLPVSEDIREELNKLRTGIVNAPVKGMVEQQDDSNFRLNLEINLRNIELNKDIQLLIRLLMRGEEKEIIAGEENILSFHNISEIDLSSFVVFKLKEKNTKEEIEFTVKAEIDNMPADRETSIFSDIINNEENFFKYLSFLLNEDADFQIPNEERGKMGNGSSTFLFNTPSFFEDMLKAASRDPEKLEEIRNLMEELNNSTKNGKTIIPEDFKELWNVFDEVLNEIKNDKSA